MVEKSAQCLSLTCAQPASLLELGGKVLPPRQVARLIENARIDTESKAAYHMLLERGLVSSADNFVAVAVESERRDARTVSCWPNRFWRVQTNKDLTSFTRAAPHSHETQTLLSATVSVGFQREFHLARPKRQRNTILMFVQGSGFVLIFTLNLFFYRSSCSASI